MSEHTTISMKKEFINQDQIQDYMNQLQIESVSELARHCIRTQVYANDGTLSQILEKTLEKSQLSPEQYQEIIEEIVEKE